MKRGKTTGAVAAALAAAFTAVGLGAGGARFGPAHERIQMIAAVGSILAVATLIVRRVDVRLALALGALPMYVATGKVAEMFGVLAAELANFKTVVPICSALGFSYVLKLTECDRCLVHLLLKPIRRVRVLLIPGGAAAGYVVNMAIVSQTGAAAVLGPILVPLLLKSGLGPVTAGSVLLLGCSMGGELFNPGAVEMVTLSGLTRLSAGALVARMRPLNLLACGVALGLFWAATARRERRDRLETQHEERQPPADDDAFRVNPIKAIVPLIPLAMLFAAPGLIVLPEGFRGLNPRDLKEMAGASNILAAMLIGVAAAVLTRPRAAGKAPSAFFEGAGYGYTHVISLIVAATVFTEGLKETRLMESLTGLLTGRSQVALVCGGITAWLLAVVCGSGIAPAVAVMKVLVPDAERLGLDPVRLGTLIAMSAHFGRTMSPAAAVAVFSARLTETTVSDLIRRVGPPLLLGLSTLLLAMLLGLI